MRKTTDANEQQSNRADQSKVIETAIHALKPCEHRLYVFAGAFFAVFILAITSSIITRQSYFAIGVTASGYLFLKMTGAARELALIMAVLSLTLVKDNASADEVRRSLLLQINPKPGRKPPAPLPTAVASSVSGFDPLSWENLHNEEIWGVIADKLKH